MRGVLVVIPFLAAALALPSLAQLTKGDVIQIIRAELEPIKLQITEINGKMATKDDIIAIQRELSSKLVAIISALIAFWATLLAAIVMIPYLYGRADRERVREMEKRIEEMRAEIEALRTLKAIIEHQEKLRETAQKLARENPKFAEAYKAIGLI
ncbi:hypothetical protein DRP77_09600 [Candidatus Poribacteria bacterium]|nr:MAG: hypothetical protein DRP77_09600 [Candidatus Poribacteria bacterium]